LCCVLQDHLPPSSRSFSFLPSSAYHTPSCVSQQKALDLSLTGQPAARRRCCPVLFLTGGLEYPTLHPTGSCTLTMRWKFSRSSGMSKRLWSAAFMLLRPRESPKLSAPNVTSLCLTIFVSEAALHCRYSMRNCVAATCSCKDQSPFIIVRVYLHIYI
jgi:hypothetical protein